ncbi:MULTISPECIES: family 16 glycosylhydrolase [unclassified Mesorhizobium]|uniref:family 16 glycosylhydrolase n=1 Tax=unclassified Mesorhizobium TaxID=325217 RepID=UPI001CCEAA75|nr:MULTISPECIES: family 16 glycosylhydrolase [unclassified Mesorhizobium]MBZ9742834.1 family 16 glycosylhydrolase [Mesorhizobium sp. CO1-1-4]MBZ9805968.1 family 16 glycosylhydrolase [Mesorhizobium sp. ES1-6]MBZ9997379.1 family 16 glycosylhydrolase [Mesorhizobium sp. BH1-1-4]
MSFFVNALGVPLPYSGASNHWYSAAGAGPDLYGSTGNDSFYGAGGANVTMHGGTGDDIYYLYGAGNKVAEGAGAGIDTISTWMSYKLPDNVENLIVTNPNNYAFGNTLDNIITAQAGHQTIDGGAGNDVLIDGGGGYDTFVISKGNGSDLIANFAATDTVRLNGYGFTSFDAIHSNMIQAGSNVLLNLGSGEILEFKDTTIDKLQPGQFKLPIDMSTMKLSFSDDFNALNLHNAQGGTWDTNFSWGAPNGSTLTSNGELQWYIDANYAPTSSVHPFSVGNGVLTITAAQAPADIKPLINNYEYTSGIITTHDTFSQTYGYFEMRADLPENTGAWPAFWLLPEDGSWPPELDVVETRGQDPNSLIMTAHSNATGTHTKVTSTVNTMDTAGFHTYGLLWTPDKLVWTYDGVQVAEAATPSDMHKPMYMLADLAVGGFAGAPPDHLATPAEMKIDYIRAYTLDNAPASALHTTSTATHSIASSTLHNGSEFGGHS